MLLRISVICALVLYVHAGADHETYKNCSRVPFCNTLRIRTGDPQYTASYVKSTSAYLNVNLKGPVDLFLKLSPIKGDIFRVEIEETATQSRYKLKDAFDGEPEVSSFEVKNGTDFIDVTLGKSKAKIQLSPFNIVFSTNDKIHTVFNQSKLSFGVVDDSKSAFSFGISFPGALGVYGLHEHADNLLLRETKPGKVDPYRLKNSDVANYETYSTMALYGAVPAIYSHSDSTTSGVYLNNAAEQWVEITYGDKSKDAYFMVKSGSLDLFVFNGPKPKDVVQQFTSLTGKHHLPPLWSLGYHQCRWNYDNQSDAKNVIALLDNNDFPVDALWLDIEYTEGKRYFTWNSKNFSDPVELQTNLTKRHKKLVTIIDPHIKVDEDYSVYTGARDKHYFVKSANGSDFKGNCWPGLSSYIDYLNPEARDYYGSMYSYDNFKKTTPTLAGIWNDMNEPSVFDVKEDELTMPDDALHFGDVRHGDIHNIYGLLHTRSTYEGLVKRDNNKVRPFVLTRSHFAGSQRYTAIWTGDNTAGWDYLVISYAECLNANILGLVFCGADIGGFSGNPDQELLQRWYQAGAWLPFYREHANMGTQRREPYLYSPAIQAVIRESIKQRYKHIPVWYTLFYEHTITGEPVIRPLFYVYPEDTNAVAIDNQLIVGKDILVRPVMDQGAKQVVVYFPGGKDEYWYPASYPKDNKVMTGEGNKTVPVDITTVPVYYRGGSIIVKKDQERLSTYEQQNDPLSLYVYLDKDLKATGRVYLDDYSSFEYQTGKKYYYAELTYDKGSNTVWARNLDPSSDSTNLYLEVARVTVFQVKSSKDNSAEYEMVANPHFSGISHLKVNL